LDFNLKELSLNIINPDLTGTIQGELKANYRPNGQIAANGQFRVSPGEFVTEVEGRSQQLKYEGGTLELSLNETGLTSRLDFKLLQQSALQGQLRLPGFNRIPMSEQQTLEAQLKGDIGDLALISVFVPMLEEVKGKLSLNLAAKGLLKQPLIQGQVRLIEGQLNVPLLGMELRDLYANIDSDSQTLGLLKIELGARSGNGNLNIIGQANPLTQHVDLTLQGDQFRLLNNVDAFVLISPNINIKVKEENVNITGTLTIPEANITPNMVVSDGSTSVGGAVRASQDTVIINDPNTTEENKTLGIAEKLKLSMNLLVKLGDNIHVDAVGFKSQVKGQIRLTHRPQDIELLPIANGELQIINGTFRSYGQDLEIERGRVIFANTVVTKPELNIKAMRRIYGDQKVEAAGIHITGNPEKINLDLFSQPSMPQDQIISYLLTGKSFDPDNPDHTIGWGTYILPNLYISYGISLLNQSNIFSVRYELNKTWGVEINIGEEDKGIDFSYTLER
jgi:translocation and assembly module TamB